MSELPTLQEIVMQALGYIPEGTPETFEDLDETMRKMYGPYWKPGDLVGNGFVPQAPLLANFEEK